MKRLMMTAAALALLTAAANADTSVTAKVLGLSFVYDKTCEKVPGFKEIATTILLYLMPDDALAGLEQAQDVQAKLGVAAFCSTYKPMVDKANASGH